MPPKSLSEVVLVLAILAPIGEEVVFRGIVESYLLLQRIGFWISIAMPGILFSLIHITPFSSAPKKVLVTILFTALIVGLLAGYYRAVSGSLLPAIVIHSLFNITGFTVGRIISRQP
ncbi:CPBP family intramembrane metalloprotease [Desulfurococcaceae archaeon MEX13E-LK6-19]|nr:CPBP family intramembrane metalloprotease [Desulfurococcaceae archaeon MEX13E-LK6-19]